MERWRKGENTWVGNGTGLGGEDRYSPGMLVSKYSTVADESLRVEGNV